VGAGSRESDWRTEQARGPLSRHLGGRRLSYRRRWGLRLLRRLIDRDAAAASLHAERRRVDTVNVIAESAMVSTATVHVFTKSPHVPASVNALELSQRTMGSCQRN
jgi:hypothetical protein